MNSKHFRPVCKGCQISYNKLISIDFCYNCQKIYDAVESFAVSMKGEFYFDPQGKILFLTCSSGHNWSSEFKTKSYFKYFLAIN